MLRLAGPGIDYFLSAQQLVAKIVHTLCRFEQNGMLEVEKTICMKGLPVRSHFIGLTSIPSFQHSILSKLLVKTHLPLNMDWIHYFVIADLENLKISVAYFIMILYLSRKV